MLQQAQQEGSLRLSVPDQAEQWEKAVTPFEKKYQIDVIVEEVPEAELAERIKTDQDSCIDAMMTRGTSTQALVEEKLLLGPIEPVLFDKTIQTSIQQDSVNSVGCLVPVSRYQTGILYDSTQLDLTDWESVEEYLENHVLTVPDPKTSMAGRGLLQTLVLNLDNSDADYSNVSLAQEIKTVNWQSALEWLEEHWESFVWTEDELTAIQAVTKGKAAVTVARSDLVAQIGAADGDIAFCVPDFQMASGSESIGISLRSEHPAAALLLVNWLVTLEGQQALYDARKTIPLCEGVVDGEGAPVSTETDTNATEFLPSVYQESLLKRFQAVIEAVEKRQEAEQDPEQQEQAKEQNP